MVELLLLCLGLADVAGCASLKVKDTFSETAPQQTQQNAANSAQHQFAPSMKISGGLRQPSAADSAGSAPHGIANQNNYESNGCVQLVSDSVPPAGGDDDSTKSDESSAGDETDEQFPPGVVPKSQGDIDYLKDLGVAKDSDTPPPAPPPIPPQPTLKQANQPQSSEKQPAAELPLPPEPMESSPIGVPQGGYQNDGGMMHLDGVDVRKVLEILSRNNGLNIVVSPNVTGRVTANLANLPPRQALEVILKSCNLIERDENGVIYIYTPQEMKVQNSGVQEDPMGVHVYQLNYTRSTDIAKIIKPFLSKEGKMTATPPSQVGVTPISLVNNQVIGGGGGSSGGSGGGGGGAAGGAGGGGGGGAQSISGGDALATPEAVVVEDRRSVLAKIDKIVTQLDVQPAQVLIEAVILSVQHTCDCELGVNFGVVNSAGQVLSVVGNGSLLNAAAGFAPQSVVVDGLLKSGFTADNVPEGQFGLSGKNLTGFIKALEEIGKVEVLATPRLLVLNKQPAELQLGDQLGYSTLSQTVVSTTQQVQFLNVGTILRVRPFISNDGAVRMEVHPERSSGQIVDGIPQAHTSEVTTNVMVPDGATLVIGGLMDTEVDTDQSGLPYLSRLPVVGYLFGQRTKSVTKKELIVLMTTHIWNSKTGCVSDDGTVATDMSGRPIPAELAPPDWLPNQSSQIPLERPEPELLPAPAPTPATPLAPMLAEPKK
ncbi:MAG TPA: hypothetical protein VMJ32_00290 [Pirellulales bacterium]|nr:hypothetical protein [Pirellulales bacterium]